MLVFRQLEDTVYIGSCSWAARGHLYILVVVVGHVSPVDTTTTQTV